MTWRNQRGKLLDFYCSVKKMEIGTRPEIRNSVEEETKTTEKLQHSKLQMLLWKSLQLLCQVFFFFFFFLTITIHKSQTETWLSQSWEKIRSSRVTTRDGCSIPFKGHGGKTNNESRAVLPPLQKEEKKPQRVQEALWDFLLFFLWTKVLAGKAVKLHFIQLVWHQAPGQERKCTIKCDLLERQRAKGLWKRRKESKRKKRKTGREGVKEGIMTC